MTSMANLDDQSADNNNTENGNNGHPRNRWRCMQPRLCNYCWKTFSNSFNLKQHIVNVHIQSQGVSCSLCDKVVKNKWYLRKHLVTAHGAPLKRVTTKSSKENGLSPSDNNVSTRCIEWCSIENHQRTIHVVNFHFLRCLDGCSECYQNFAFFTQFFHT